MELIEKLEAIISIDVPQEVRTNPDVLQLGEQLEKATNNLRFLSGFVKFKQYLLNMNQYHSDIYIQTLAKSGTTLTQMIIYQMTTDGNMDFDHLYDASPFIDKIRRMSTKDLKELQLKPPVNGERRILKSHSDYNCFESIKKGKFIHVIRDPFDQLLSFYHHNKNYYQPDLKFENFVKEAHIKRFFRYNSEWIKNENDFNIIYLNYEDIVENKPDVVRRLAKFLDIEITNKDMERILERTSFSFMKKHQTKFGEQPESGDDSRKQYDKFIRKGKIGEGKDYFTKEQVEKFYELSKDFFRNHEVTKRYFDN